MTGTVTKAKAMRGDLALYDGKTYSASRLDSTGGTLSGLPVTDYVDVLSVYGAGSSYTGGTLQDAARKIGSSSKVALWLTTGTWTIDDDITLTKNLTVFIQAGCVLSVSSGKTLTINGPVITGFDGWKGGSGTIVARDVNDFVRGVDDLRYIGIPSNGTTKSIGGGGGGVFRYDTTVNRNTHDGVTIFDPTHSDAFGASGSWSAENSGGGCWVRLDDKDFDWRWGGAVIDGSTDDSSAINAVHLAAYTAGAAVSAPPGTAYVGTSVINHYPGLVVRGQGFDKTFVRGHGAVTWQTVDANGVATQNSKDTTEMPILKELTIEGNNTGTNGVHWYSATRARMDSVRIWKFTGVGLKLGGGKAGNGSFYMDFFHCMIRQNGTGVKFVDGSSTKVNQTTFWGGHIAANSVRGIDNQGSVGYSNHFIGVAIENNDIYHDSSSGLWVWKFCYLEVVTVTFTSQTNRSIFTENFVGAGVTFSLAGGPHTLQRDQIVTTQHPHAGGLLIKRDTAEQQAFGGKVDGDSWNRFSINMNSIDLGDGTVAPYRFLHLGGPTQKEYVKSYTADYTPDVIDGHSHRMSALTGNTIIRKPSVVIGAPFFAFQFVDDGSPRQVTFDSAGYITTSAFPYTTAGGGERITVTFLYSDGFGKFVQTGFVNGL